MFGYSPSCFSIVIPQTRVADGQHTPKLFISVWHVARGSTNRYHTEVHKISFMMIVATTFILACLFSVVKGISPSDCTEGPCGPGEHLEIQSQSCIPCIKGSSYMPHTHTQHNCQSCYRCTGSGLTNPDFKEVAECTIFEDTRYECKDKENYFMALPDIPYARYCKLCRKCGPDEVELAPCDGFHDRQCAAKTVQPTGITENVTLPTTFDEPTTAELDTSTKGSGPDDTVKESVLTVIIVYVVPVIALLVVIIAVIYIIYKHRPRNPHRYNGAPTSDEPENV